MNRAELGRFADIDVTTLQHQLKAVLCSYQSRQPLCATAAGQESDLRLGQAQLCCRIVCGHPVVAGKAYLKTAAERCAVDCRNERLTAGLHLAQQAAQSAGVVMRLSGRRKLSVLFQSNRILLGRCLHEGQISSSTERFLAGGQDDPLDGIIAGSLCNQFFQFIHEVIVNDVHGLAADVPVGDCDAV